MFIKKNIKKIIIAIVFLLIALSIPLITLRANTNSLNSIQNNTLEVAVAFDKPNGVPLGECTLITMTVVNPSLFSADINTRVSDLLGNSAVWVMNIPVQNKYNFELTMASTGMGTVSPANIIGAFNEYYANYCAPNVIP